MSSESVSSFNVNDDSVATGPVPVSEFVPKSANLYPKMEQHINEAGWELWEFEAYAADGETAVGISFFRDARGLSEGGFHADVNVMLPGGKKWGQTIHFPQSVITARSPVNSLSTDTKFDVTGIWKSSASDGHERSISFSVAQDLSVANVRFEVPGCVEGSIELRTLGSKKQARLPTTEEEALLCPSVYYIFPMGPTAAEANVIVWEEGAHQVEMHVRADNGGRGGMVRGWSALAWPQFMNDAYYMVAHVGPYMLQLLHIVSSPASGCASHAVARLYCNNELVCTANRAGPLDAGVQLDAVSVEKVIPEISGRQGLCGAFRDKNTGYVIEFVPARQVGRLRFEVRHRRAWWSDPTSAPGPQGTGKSGWVEAVFGGSDIHAEMFEGVGVGGQMQLP